MKIGSALLLCAAIIAAMAVVAPADTTDEAAIIQTALDYIEGWYEGNAERMERALHPDLAKRTVFPDKATGKSVLKHMTAAELVAATATGYGKNTPKENQMKEVTILDRYGNTACVKIIAGDWIDYLQVAKFDGRWVIVNVLWEMKPRTQ